MFEEVQRETSGAHTYVKVKPANDPQYVRSIAKRVQSAYFDRQASRDQLIQAVAELRNFDGSAFEVSAEDIETALAEELNAVIPQEWKTESKRLKQLDVQRSELAEIIAHEVLVTIFGTVIPASRIKNKEIPDQPTRGADLIGLDDIDRNPVPVLVLSEVKGSGDAKSPPAVISGMREKLGELTTDRRNLLQELTWLRENSEDQYARRCGKLYAYFVLNRGPLRVTLAPVLLRTASTSKDGDPGVFIDDAESFGCDVRFTSVILDVADLFDFAVEVYRLARELDQ